MIAKPKGFKNFMIVTILLVKIILVCQPFILCFGIYRIVYIPSEMNKFIQ